MHPLHPFNRYLFKDLQAVSQIPKNFRVYHGVLVDLSSIFLNNYGIYLHTNNDHINCKAIFFHLALIFDNTLQIKDNTYYAM